MLSSTLNHQPTCRFLLPAIALMSLPDSVQADGHSPRQRAASGSYHSVSVAENVLTLSPLPDFRLDVAQEFTYLGSTSFLLGDRAEADVFVFADKDGDSVERFVKVQVESLLDDVANDYSWEGTDTLRVAGAEYLLGYWCFDAAELALERPESDTAKTQEWLAANGHRQTGVFIGTRLARVFAEGRSEVLLFYGETTRLTGIECDDEHAAMEHLPSVVGRSDAAFVLGE